MNCTDLWLGNSYCVQPVGNIKTYSGYSVSSSGYSALPTTINLNATLTANRSTTHFFPTLTPVTTSTFVYNSTAVSFAHNYTLCSQALKYYNITNGDIPESVVQDSQWYSEYQRVCLLNLSQPLPTIPFNISTTGIRISPDGTCGESYGYTCKGSSFGDCCSIYGYWYSIPIFTTFYSQDSDSNYQYTVVLVVTTAVLIVIRSMGTAVRIVHHLRLRLVLLRHCHQLQLHQLQQLQFLRMVHAQRLMDILAKGQPSGTVVAYMVIAVPPATIVAQIVTSTMAIVLRPRIIRTGQRDLTKLL
ncbi:hypothetical protein C8Q69DRAFT_104382 [Paecilomyces variotii]|uniref:Transmembrane protein n=1 Tax=Byssochlamys spectabilis TaxID=264951 RepID=A0A443HJW6_BYSSP|nr:hypothetical protein C8Q69DRAFT_104382 [Paecilomyces variotii]RWQ92142.1 hypothetical protein C8Q69DRAFT_104382 [Paecilomyces variotii]